jgi:hypothetical protein
MFRKQVIRLIHNEDRIPPEKRGALIKLAQMNPDYTARTIRWILALLDLTSSNYWSLLCFQKEEIVRCMADGFGGGRVNQACFRRTLFVLLGDRPGSTEAEACRSLSGVILDKLREENQVEVKALMIELLIRNPEGFPEEIMPEDLCVGLHHPDEVVRSRTLMTLHERFGSKGLRIALREIDNLTGTPSVVFFGTLRHLVRKHPELMWEADCRSSLVQKVRSFMHMGNAEWEEEGSVTLFPPAWRLGCRIASIPDNREKEPNGFASRKTVVNGRQGHPSELLRIERFKAMGCHDYLPVSGIEYRDRDA